MAEYEVRSADVQSGIMAFFALKLSTLLSLFELLSKSLVLFTIVFCLIPVFYATSVVVIRLLGGK